ncbi:MAG: DUF2802 domain-containing protein [Gammaproteobacteria bacterium]|nr:MAG: DUF2802 domain-containing protein [Gammaproteobacteria bacterium]
MISVILILLVMALSAGLALQYRALDRIKRNASELADSLRLAQDRVKQMEQELGALCSASVGAGDHLMRLEQQVRRINERQNVLEMRSVGDRPYAQASELVHKGADIEELMEACGLTRGEAELLVMMQRGSA